MKIEKEAYILGLACLYGASIFSNYMFGVSVFKIGFVITTILLIVLGVWLSKDISSEKIFPISLLGTACIVLALVVISGTPAGYLGLRVLTYPGLLLFFLGAYRFLKRRITQESSHIFTLNTGNGELFFGAGPSWELSITIGGNIIAYDAFMLDPKDNQTSLEDKIGPLLAKANAKIKTFAENGGDLNKMVSDFSNGTIDMEGLKWSDVFKHLLTTKEKIEYVLGAPQNQAMRQLIKQLILKHHKPVQGVRIIKVSIKKAEVEGTNSFAFLQAFSEAGMSMDLLKRITGSGSKKEKNSAKKDDKS